MNESLVMPSQQNKLWWFLLSIGVRAFHLCENSEEFNYDIKIPVHSFDAARIQKEVCIYLFLMEFLDAGAQFCDSFKKTVIIW